MAVSKTFVLALAAALAPGALGRVLPPSDTLRINADSNPYCPAGSTCVLDGKFLAPELDFASESSSGEAAFKQYLPTHTFTVSQWNNGKMPERCYYWAVEADKWNAADFTVYNVTFSDCSTPYVVCRHKNAPKTVSEIATVISRVPIKIRQANSIYLVYSDSQSDNPNYTGYLATLAGDGIVIGRSTAYFTAPLIHETTHDVDYRFVTPETSFSDSATWRNAVAADGYNISPYGAVSYAEGFADTGKAVLLDAIYPGGLAAWSTAGANLTQVANQLRVFKATVGSYYTTGGTCDPAKKFPFPTVLRDVPLPATTTRPPVTATPYGQCGGWSTYTGPTACGTPYSCTSLNPYYSQCVPTPAP
ncbi:hypothetical protein B0H63DRAFT_518655 [Podospora didyma]|uniref:CBM1 domain-containing protein n=1 Tax=Podospora didyma TaxID=330526 RepID=A0AAE0NXA5_9PEZI|nr:hypothetical protein B0H63DRAFT_518655 [Podospora didyma]